MRKKSLADRLSHAVIARITQAEHEALLQVLSDLGTTRSRLLTKIVRELIAEGPELLKHELNVIEEMIYQIGGLGRNLNQLMRAIHMGKVAALENQTVQIEELQKSVETLRLELHEVVYRSRKRWVGHGG